nr:uncharacterized protein LOC105326448 isoform X2 [Crassostrea gigas]
MLLGYFQFLVLILVSSYQTEGHETTCRYPYREIHCLHKGGYLANLETFNEYIFLRSWLAALNNGRSYWIGGRNINREIQGGDWRWVKNGTFSKMSYYAFGPGQPSGSKGTPENCLWLYPTYHYQFIDDICTYSVYYICEK